MSIQKRMIMAALTLLVFSAIVLSITHYTNMLQKNDPFIMNIVGRQRMLTQKISKNFILMHSINDVEKVKHISYELKKNIELFYESQNALINGGEVPLTMNINGPTKYIGPIQGQAFVMLTEGSVTADRLFTPLYFDERFHEQIKDNFNNDSGTKLLNTLDAAMDTLESEWQSKASLDIRTQRISLALSFICLLVLMSGVLNRFLKPLRAIRGQTSKLKSEPSIPDDKRHLKNHFLLIHTLAKSRSFYLKVVFLIFVMTTFSILGTALIRQSQSHDPSVINLISRQAMTIQKIAKEGLLLKAPLDEKMHQEISDQLVQSIELFQLTQKALMFGGYAPATFKPSGKQVLVSLPQNHVLTKLAKVKKMADQLVDSIEHKNNVKKFELSEGPQLFSLLNELVDDIQLQAERKMHHEIIAQLLCFIFSVISFLGAIFICRKKFLLPLLDAMKNIESESMGLNASQENQSEASEAVDQHYLASIESLKYKIENLTKEFS